MRQPPVQDDPFEWSQEWSCFYRFDCKRKQIQWLEWRTIYIYLINHVFSWIQIVIGVHSWFNRSELYLNNENQPWKSCWKNQKIVVGKCYCHSQDVSYNNRIMLRRIKYVFKAFSDAEIKNWISGKWKLK